MAEKRLEVEWTRLALGALNDIYDFYAPKSEIAAVKLISGIIYVTESIKFPQQYQVDDINPKFRRIIYSHYKILYTERNSIIKIADIIDTRQSPEILKNK